METSHRAPPIGPESGGWIPTFPGWHSGRHPRAGRDALIRYTGTRAAGGSQCPTGKRELVMTRSYVEATSIKSVSMPKPHSPISSAHRTRQPQGHWPRGRCRNNSHDQGGSHWGELSPSPGGGVLWGGCGGQWDWYARTFLWAPMMRSAEVEESHKQLFGCIVQACGNQGWVVNSLSSFKVLLDQVPSGEKLFARHAPLPCNFWLGSSHPWTTTITCPTVLCKLIRNDVWAEHHESLSSATQLHVVGSASHLTLMPSRKESVSISRK